MLTGRCQQGPYEPGMANKIVWFEVVGKEGDRLKGFFGELFGWKYNEAKEFNYGMTDAELTGIPGGVGVAPVGASWATFYVGVDDIEAALAKAKRLGGKELLPVTKLPDASFFAVFADPEGHPIGLFQKG
jgi:predicted enzyme related to lactoylglutathione lyase